MMLKTWTLILVILMAAGGAWFQPQPGAPGDSDMITPQEVMRLLEQADPGMVLVDVRTGEEYRESHIPGSILVPLLELAETMPFFVPDREQIVVIYCRSGNRTKTARPILLELGYKQVYDLGGIIDWPYDVVKDQN